MPSVRSIEQAYKDWKAGKLTARQFQLIYGIHPSLYPQRYKESAERVKQNLAEADQEAVRAKNQAAAHTFDERHLSLQEGYTALDKMTSNPPFDPRITALTLGEASKVLQRGRMVQNGYYAQRRSGKQSGAFTVNFLYNPSSISVTYAGAPGVWNPAELTENQAAGNANFFGMQTMRFDLLFDRTYEVAYLKTPHPKMRDYDEALSAGVYADIRALERLVGIEKGNGGIQAVPIDVYFGATFSGGDKTRTYTNKRGQVITEILGKKKSTRPLGFFGVVTGMDVTYTHFSHTMTPMRATVNISMSQVPRDNSAPGGIGAYDFVSDEDAAEIENE